MTRSVSVLVDGDNISCKHAAKILSVASKHGEPAVVRAYTDVQHRSEWCDAAGYRFIHAGTGKNAADILLALDALELLLSRDSHCFVIASSDGDFTHIATRLREHGAKVIGVGEAKAPMSFRASCTDFVEIAAPQPSNATQAPATPCKGLDEKIRVIIATHSKKGTGIRIAELAPKMHSLHGVRISTLPERNWRGYLSARPNLYELDPRGPEAMVRFLPKGFA